MSETSSQPEQSRLPLARKVRPRLGLAAVTGLAVISGAFGGYELIGQGSIKESRSNHLAQAARDVRCVGIVKRLAKPGSSIAIVQPGALTSQEQTDCGVSGVNPATTSPNSSSSSPQGIIVRTDVKLELPSVARLRADEHQQYIAAAGTENLGYKATGIFLGGVVGGLVTFVGGDALLSIAGQRRPSDIPPETTGQSAAS